MCLTRLEMNTIIARGTSYTAAHRLQIIVPPANIPHPTGGTDALKNNVAFDEAKKMETVLNRKRQHGSCARMLTMTLPTR